MRRLLPLALLASTAFVAPHAAAEGGMSSSDGWDVGDWHPLDNGFRLSAGVFVNNTELDVDAQPSGGSFEFDGQTCTAAEVGRAKGKADLDTVRRTSASAAATHWAQTAG